MNIKMTVRVYGMFVLRERVRVYVGVRVSRSVKIRMSVAVVITVRAYGKD